MVALWPWPCACDVNVVAGSVSAAADACPEGEMLKLVLYYSLGARVRISDGQK